MNKYALAFCFCALLLAVACKKKDNLVISEIPTLELISINDTEIKEFSDSLVFTISYRDGDGDLGNSSPDSTVIELVDNRDPQNLIFGYHLSPRSPDGASLIVQGQLQLVLTNIILLNSSATSETTTFSIRIKDRAQNWSNTVVSGEVRIVK
jgi:hypothetical protein